MLNLVSNAIKFTNFGGNVKIKVEFFEETDKFQIIDSKKYLRLYVIDDGIGIHKKDKNKIFKLFGCIKDEKNHVNTKGIGLGLVISKMIVNKFDGQIDFKSKINKGTMFYFTFGIEDEHE